MLISVIVPFFNSGKYFRECLESIISQDYNDMDIILVNDGSVDESLDIAREFALVDDRILIVNKLHGGLGSTRNMGIEFIKGSRLRRQVDSMILGLRSGSVGSPDSGHGSPPPASQANPTLASVCSHVDPDMDLLDQQFCWQLLGGDVNVPMPSWQGSLESRLGYIVDIVSRNEICVRARSIYDALGRSDLSDNLDGISRYINFTDSDDKLHPAAFHESLKMCESMDLDILNFDDEPLFDGVSPQSKHIVKTRCIAKYHGVLCNPRHYLRQFLHGDFSFVWMGLIHLRVLGKLRFLENIIHEDHHFGINLFYRSERLSFLNKVMYYYRIRPNSICDYGRVTDSSSFFYPLFKYFDSPLHAKLYCIYFSRIVSTYHFYCDGELGEPFRSNFCFSYLADGIYIKRYRNDPLNAQRYISDLLPFIKSMGFRTNFAMKWPRLFMFLLWLKSRARSHPHDRP